ncbi:MAG: DNA-formamidopyrimidine glycosylase [Anaerolineaceae bacterium 4572_32.2]|nr:MAG: DNA-formamidopyrimidine glycosylase [Anaerolineaceae bacterium 4572_32.2]HEY72412.1 bifunctional DNA-formamidopyrimidine glycosylase/DNA-(apurinic or apyrimidinic site) lyase [Thermoflexia bacterium]
MPELPEVETVVRGLRASLVGRAITGAEVHWARSVVPPDPAAFTRRLTGQTVAKVGRRGKWIVIELNGSGALLIHLRMTGRLALEKGECADDRHLRVQLSLDDGRSLRFYDPRKFGRLRLADDPAAALSDLGSEPLADDFTAARLEEMLARRRGCIKPLLLNQHFLAGLGNIYTDESLWRAGVHPLRQANTLTPDEARRLHRAIRAVLRAAIASGGTTLPDAAYQQVDGRLGEFAVQLAAYGRAGEPCPRCGARIERIRVGQRGTHFCPRCQPLPK